jgi:hypothetical protein
LLRKEYRSVELITILFVFSLTGETIGWNILWEVGAPFCGNMELELLELFDFSWFVDVCFSFFRFSLCSFFYNVFCGIVVLIFCRFTRQLLFPSYRLSRMTNQYYYQLLNNWQTTNIIIHLPPKPSANIFCNTFYTDRSSIQFLVPKDLPKKFLRLLKRALWERGTITGWRDKFLIWILIIDIRHRAFILEIWSELFVHSKPLTRAPLMRYSRLLAILRGIQDTKNVARQSMTQKIEKLLIISWLLLSRT